MINAKENLIGEISEKNTLSGEINVTTMLISPPLINLEITPTEEKQVFNHDGFYGYDVVTVNPMESLSIDVEDNILVFSNGDVEEGELIL